MAEKEERIYTFTKKQMCNKCKEICDEWDGLVADCGNCGYVLLPSMTRQEAIERMAKAICKFEMMSARRVCKECSKECFEHLELEVVNKAEAALNALLGYYK